MSTIPSPSVTNLKPFQQRVVDEQLALDDKLSRLRAFIGNPPDVPPHQQFTLLPEAEQDRMKRQLHIMQEYSAVLGERIEAFE